MHSYDTVTAAVKGLKDRGYTMDFNLSENCLVCNKDRLDVRDFEITEVHRFEGFTDPADEAAVYAVEGKNGEKGVLVTGYGPSEGVGAEMAAKLQMHKN